MANTLTVDQSALILRAVISQATGQSNLAALDTAQLLTIGQKLLTTNTDPIINAISQVISRTIISARPYRRKFASLMRDPEAWGNIVRKITILEDPADLENNEYLELVDGEAIDQYKVRKPKALELRFVGQQTYQICKTIFTTQLNTAFYSADDFGRFISAIFVYVANKIEKINEERTRTTIAGFIAGKIASVNANVESSGSVVHLLTEYNQATGLNLTAQTVYQPDNFDGFMKWVYARMAGVSNLLTEYSTAYHTNLAEGDILRHTPKEYQRCLVYAPIFYQTTSRVLADTYHDTFLQIPGAEMVNFWQAIETPDSIQVKSAQYLAANGNITATSEAVTQANVFGIMFDMEALGFSPILEGSYTTPYNAAGEYTNVFWKFNNRAWQDYTENAVVFLLD